MTLAQWTAATGIQPTHPTTETGAVSLISSADRTKYHGHLWHLSDYKVSTVSGVVIWLVPVKVPAAYPPCG